MRRAVINRARDRCEYCCLAQAGQEAAFHIDHIKPEIAEGQTVLENLALACVSCSLRKGPRQTGQDPNDKVDFPLFNPRHHSWTEHFRWEGVEIVGLTAIGRATVETLKLNRPLALSIREEEILRNRYPPKDADKK